jgi:hypothetical protein
MRRGCWDENASPCSRGASHNKQSAMGNPNALVTAIRQRRSLSLTRDIARADPSLLLKMYDVVYAGCLPLQLVVNFCSPVEVIDSLVEEWGQAHQEKTNDGWPPLYIAIHRKCRLPRI